MTPAALAIPQPVHVTAQQWEELPEDEGVRTEVIDGFLRVSPPPTPPHQWLMVQLATELNRQCPKPHAAIVEIELRLQDEPVTARAPDVMVLTDWPQERFVRPEQVVLAVELLSPSTMTEDCPHKRAEYAAAGIPNYWVVDILHGAPKLVTYHLEGSEYRGVDLSGTQIVVDRPFRIELDLEQLTAP